MAPRTPKAAPLPKLSIPDDVVCYAILPRLTFKQVARLRALSKLHRSVLTDDPKFASEQARLCPPCPALIDVCANELVVQSSTPATVGIPSTRLDFLGASTRWTYLNLLASTHGLLCIRGDREPPEASTAFFIVNPSTQQARPIPGAVEHVGDMGLTLGLAFDPSVDAHKFKIVQAFRFERLSAGGEHAGSEFHFSVFSSDTGRWVSPDTRVAYADIVPSWAADSVVSWDKVVYADGVLYWDYLLFVLWFDVATDAAGTIKMPWPAPSPDLFGPEHTIDASADGRQLVFTAIDDKDGLAVYHLHLVKKKIGTGTHLLYHWEMKHRKAGEEIMAASGGSPERLRARPLGVESGRWVYCLEHGSHRLLLYDMEIGTVDDTGKRFGHDYFLLIPAFDYRNSMAAIPPIAAPASQAGICDGKDGGCICGSDQIMQ